MEEHIGGDAPAQAEIELSAEERERERLSRPHLDLAVLLLHTCGYVVLKRALAGELVETLRAAHETVFYDCVETARVAGVELEGRTRLLNGRATGTPFRFNEGRWQVFQSLASPLGAPELVANPIVLSIVEAALGGDFYCDYTAIVSSWRGSLLQPPHRDAVAWRRSPRAYFAVVPLADWTAETGYLDIWPGGTHLWDTQVIERHGMGSGGYRNPDIESIVQHGRPHTLSLEKGDILVRDPAIFHRGMPNQSDAPRAMAWFNYYTRSYVAPYDYPHFTLDRQTFDRMPARAKRLYDHAIRRASVAAARYRVARLASRIGSRGEP